MTPDACRGHQVALSVVGLWLQQLVTTRGKKPGSFHVRLTRGKDFIHLMPVKSGTDRELKAKTTL